MSDSGNFLDGQERPRNNHKKGHKNDDKGILDDIDEDIINDNYDKFKNPQLVDFSSEL